MKSHKLQQEKTRLQNAVSKLTDDIKDVHNKTMTGQDDYKALHDSKLELEVKVDGLVRYCDMMQRQLKEAMTGSIIKNTDNEIRALRDQVHKAHEIIRKNEKDIQKKTSEVKQLHAKLNNSERLRDEVNQCKKLEIEYRNNIRQLKEENNELLRLSNRRTASLRHASNPARSVGGSSSSGHSSASSEHLHTLLNSTNINKYKKNLVLLYIMNFL
eukprot:UN32361